jgi:hypothetical protein
MINKTLHRKLRIGQQDSTKTKGEDQMYTHLYILIDFIADVLYINGYNPVFLWNT